MLICFRIHPEIWLNEERFKELLDYLKNYYKVTDELAFFTAWTHPPLPLSDIESRAKRLSAIFPRVRQLGISPGVNVLATIGHHEENLPNSLSGPYQRLIDPDGNECKGSFCSSDPNFIHYVQRLYTLIARASPDFIWIDDDVRLAGHMPIDYGCFCKYCLEDFSKQIGKNFDRKALIMAFSGRTTIEQLELRNQWLEYNRNKIDKLLQVIEETVHMIDPKISLGFMTGDRFYEGYSFHRWAKTLAGKISATVRWRPGGGFYSDEILLGMVEKAHEIGRQTSQLPADIKIIQSEVENFPWHILRKSVRTTMLEAAVYMGSGATGVAFNVLSQDSKSIEEYRPFFESIIAHRPFYQHLSIELGRSKIVGLWPAWNESLFVSAGIDDKWPGGNTGIGFFRKPYVLSEIGIPLCYDQSGATATALSGNTPFAFTLSELKKIFSKGVLMDVEAWYALERLGVSKWTGVKPTRKISRDAIEVFAKHALNGKYAGWRRDCRQSFWQEEAQLLEPVAPRVETLCHLIDYSENNLGISMTAYENELVGRVVVMGYFPWSYLHNLAKSSQMKSIYEWLSYNSQPATVESFAKVVIWCHKANSKNIIILLNASLDSIEEINLRVRGHVTSYKFMSMNDKKITEIEGQKSEFPEQVRLILKNLSPWNLYLLTES